MVTRVRSPNYPSISLPDAIERARKVYKSEHTHKTPPEVVARHIGYAGLNGASLMVLSTLKKYGLLEEVGRDLKITQDALTILVDPEDSRERAEAIRRAAYAPALFERLHAEYGEKVPSDENLRAFLLKNGFSQGAVDTPIRCYRETMEFVSRLPGAYNRESPQEPEVTTTDELVNQQADLAAARASASVTARLSDAPIPAGFKKDVWDLDEGRVTLERPAELSDESLEYLEAWLQLVLKKIKKQSLNPAKDRRRVDLDDDEQSADPKA